MRTQVYQYTPLTVMDVTLAPEEVFTFPAFNARPCIGTIYVRGCIMPIGDTTWQPIAEHREWRERSVWGGWDCPDATEGAATFKAAPGGARWICLSHRIDKDGNIIGPEREVEHHAIDGEFTVPAGWGFVVAWVEPIALPREEEDEAIEYEPGRITFTGQEAVTGNYVRPREAEFVVTGTADLLLVR